MAIAEMERAIALPDGRETTVPSELALLIAQAMVYVATVLATASMDGVGLIALNVSSAPMTALAMVAARISHAPVTRAGWGMTALLKHA